MDGHGTATEMFLAPEQNSGIFYASQNRRSEAWQFGATLSAFVSGYSGEHLVKGGVDVLHASLDGELALRPINILREDGTLTRRLTAGPAVGKFAATDFSAFVQDRWHVNNHLLLEYGVRVERDGVFGRANFIPRFGAAVALDPERLATIRGGWGYFFERTPLMAGAFSQMPDLTEAAYGADGKALLGTPTVYEHTLDENPRTPRSTTWNIGYEHRIRPWVSVRANHLHREGSHELMADTWMDGARGIMQMTTKGRSSYRDTEIGAHFRRGTTLDLDVSYTHSSSLADLNDAYGYFLNLTANPILRANAYGPTDTDAPNRFVGRGRATVGRNWVFELAGGAAKRPALLGRERAARVRGDAQQPPVPGLRHHGRVVRAARQDRPVRTVVRRGLHQRPELLQPGGRPAERGVAGVRRVLQFDDQADPDHGALPLLRSVWIRMGRLFSAPQDGIMNIFVLNCGSSSLKFQIIETDADLIEKDGDRQLAKGLIERIGSEAIITYQVGDRTPVKGAAPLRDHKAALAHVIKWVTAPETNIPGIAGLADIHAIGHRVVHGAERFKGSHLIDSSVIAGLQECIDLAPLHNPANLKGIYAATELFGPTMAQVAVFDTAFHSTLPETAYLYAVPYQLYRRFKIRKYGFHGTSHRYIAYRYRKLTGKQRKETNIITVHLGNGCSACAIKGGKSVDTSMGMTPLEGLMMGTRSGDIDPTVIEFLMHKEGTSVDEIFSTLNKRSGLLGRVGAHQRHARSGE